MTASVIDAGLLSNRGLRRASVSSVVRPEATMSDLAPPWLAEVERRFLSFVDLEPNWNSYGGVPVHESVARAAGDLLRRVAGPSAPEPTVVPTSAGGIQFEWHTTTADLEIELASAGRVSAAFEDRASDEEWEQDFSSDLNPLVHALARLAESS